MTNKEKYKEVFGFEPDRLACPSNNCALCPLFSLPGNHFPYIIENEFWNKEYIESEVSNDN